MKKKFILTFPIFFFLSSAPADPSKTLQLELSELQFKNSVLEGEIRNNGSKAAKEVWIHVAFKDSKGAAVMEQDFRVVPGGDGKSIPEGWTKHFRYNLKLNGTGKLNPVGSIKAATFE